MSIGGRHCHTHQGARWFPSFIPSFMPPTASAPSSEKSPLRSVLAARSLLLQMNILARTLMDGPTDLNPGRRADKGCRNSHFKAHTMHNATAAALVVKFRLFRNAGSSSLMRPGCQSIGTIPEAQALILAFRQGRGNRGEAGVGLLDSGVSYSWSSTYSPSMNGKKGGGKVNNSLL